MSPTPPDRERHPPPSRPAYWPERREPGDGQQAPDASRRDQRPGLGRSGPRPSEAARPVSRGPGPAAPPRPPAAGTPVAGAPPADTRSRPPASAPRPATPPTDAPPARGGREPSPDEVVVPTTSLRGREQSARPAGERFADRSAPAAATRQVGRPAQTDDGRPPRGATGREVTRTQPGRPAAPPRTQGPPRTARSAGAAAAATAERPQAIQPAPPAAPARPAPGPRRTTRRRSTVRKVDPWSVLKLSLIFYFCVLLVVMLALTVFWAVVNQLGLIDRLLAFLADLQLVVEIRGGMIARAVFLIGLLNVVLWSGINVFLAFLYNLISDLAGGLRVSFLDEQ